MLFWGGWQPVLWSWGILKQKSRNCQRKTDFQKKRNLIKQQWSAVKLCRDFIQLSFASSCTCNTKQLLVICSLGGNHLFAELQWLFPLQNALDYLECGLSKSYSTSSHALGIDLWRGRRCCSGNLQLPPLSQRQTEKARTPDRDIVCRPTTLPLLAPPSIAITTYQDW